MDKHTKLMLDLELFNDKWVREWGNMVRKDTQPTRETMRMLLKELREVMKNNIDQSKVQELIDYACE
jgi:hypothetical protein